MLHAQRDIDSGMVDTDMRATPGLVTQGGVCMRPRVELAMID